MYIRIVNLKFASEIEADAMQAYAEHELINKLPGILSIEVVKVTNLHSVVINKGKKSFIYFSSLSTKEIRFFNALLGTSTQRFFAARPFLIRVKKSAIGSDIDIIFIPTS